MVTTIQVDERTLHLLKKLKEETNSDSYDEVIIKIVLDRHKKESLAGYFGKKSKKEILKDLRDENDRF